MPMTAADLTVKVGADTSDFEQGMGKVDSSLNKSKAGMGAATGILGAGALSIGGGFLYAANSAMNFEGAMADVDASLLPTTQQLEALEREALKIGQVTTFNATEGAQAIEALGLAGIGIADIMNGGAMSVAQLASATGEDLPNSATAMANAMTIFGIAGDQTGATADTMTAALNESSLTLTDFANGMASAGVQANAVGMSFEQTSAALALFSANGMSGADAGTALRSMLTYMANPTAEAAALFDQLGFSMQEGIESGDLMAYTADKLSTGLAGMSETERMAALNTMFGADAQRVANILYGEGAAGVSEMTEKMKANGQAQEAARRRLGGLRGAMESLSGSVETAAIIIGSGLTPFLTRLAEGVGDAVNWFTDLPEPLIRLVSIVAGVVGALMGLGAAFGSVMMMGGLIPGGFGAVGSAMLALLGPVALVVAAAIGLYVAFETNFLGIRDIVTTAFDAISTAFGALGDIIGGTFTGDLEQVKQGFENLAEPLQPLGEFVGEVTQSFVDLYDAFEAGGLSGLIDALPGELMAMGSAFADLGSAIMDGIGNIDWGGLFSNLGEIAGNIWDWLTGQLGRVDWQGAWETALSVLSSVGSWLYNTLGDAAANIGTWIGEQVRRVDWQGAFETAMDVLSAVGSWVYGKLGDAAASIGTWLVAQVSAVDWSGAFQTAMTVLGAVGGWLVEQLGDAASAIGTWLTNQVGRVDWKGAFQAGMSAVSSAGAWIAEKLGDAATAIGTWLKNQITGINWASVQSTVSTNLRTAIRDGVQGMAGIAAIVLSWMSDQIRGVDWNTVGSTLASLLVTGIKGVVGLVGLSAWLLAQFTLALIDVDWGGLAIAIGSFLLTALTGLAGFLSGFYMTLYSEIATELGNVDWGMLGTIIKNAFISAVKGIGTSIWGIIEGEILTGSEGFDWNRLLPSAPMEDEPADNKAFDWSRIGVSAGPGGFQNPLAGMFGSGSGGGGSESVNIDTSLAIESLSALTRAVHGTKAAFDDFTATTIGVMGGWSAAIGTLTTTAVTSLQTNLAGGIASAVSAIASFAAVTIGTLGGWSSAVGTLATTASTRLQTAIAGGVASAQSAIASFVGNTVGTLGGWAAAVGTLATTAMTRLQTAVAGGVASAQSAITSFTGNTIGVLGGWSSAVGAISSTAANTLASNVSRGAFEAAGGMARGMQQATSAVGQQAGAWVAIVSGVAGQMEGAGYNAGAAAAGGIVAGLKSMLGAVEATAAAIASAAASAMSAALAISSPSKVTTRLGAFAGQGLAIGIMDTRSAVEENARAVAQAAVRAFAIDIAAPVMAVEGPTGRPRALMRSRAGEVPQYVYNDQRTFTVKVDDLPELVRATDFLNDLERDREMMYGGS